MPTCYLVPGLFGTSLGTSVTSLSDTWVSYSTFAVGGIGRMRLAPDGISPGAPDGVQLYPGAPLPDYYDVALLSMERTLRPLGYVVQSLGYDWRLSARVTGPILAQRLRELVRPDDPCALVCHSFGGIVARFAWRELARTGDTGLVRRIVTLGTPHWGSYAIPALWSYDDPTLQQLGILTGSAITILSPPVAYATGRVWSADRIAALTASWPSSYEVLPSLLAPSAGADPHRAAVYDGLWPANRGVSLVRLSEAREVFQPLLASAATRPPAWVMTTVAGHYLTTPSRLLVPDQLGDPGVIGTESDADGKVCVADALLEGSAQVEVVAAHNDIPAVVAGDGLLADLVAEVRVPPAPPPPPRVVPGTMHVVLAGPPVGVPLGTARGCTCCGRS